MFLKKKIKHSNFNSINTITLFIFSKLLNKKHIYIYIYSLQSKNSKMFNCTIMESVMSFYGHEMTCFKICIENVVIKRLRHNYYFNSMLKNSVKKRK